MQHASNHLLFETICLKDGILLNLPYHEARLNNSRKALFHCSDHLQLSTIALPKEATQGLWKCRILYQQNIFDIQFHRYEPRTITTLTCVFCESIDYTYKYVDRSAIEQLQIGVQTDDILIIKNGFITDTSFGNVVFYDGKNWITPSHPLLKGTSRARLLELGQIQEAEIKLHDLSKFQGLVIVNAMLPLKLNRIIPLTNIVSKL